MEADRPIRPDLALEAWRRTRQEVHQALHDTLCQTIGGADLLARVLAARLAAGESLVPADFARLQAALDRAREEAQELNRRFQSLARPEALMGALEHLAEATGSEFRPDGSVLVHDPEVAQLLYLLAREAVDNARRHADATHVTISLASKDDQVTIQISDDGCGFSPADECRGLAMMRWHAAQAGAEFTVDSQPGRGTIIRGVVTTPSQINA